MPKDFFQFKQFLIRQDRCGMKVCTDSCILGAYTKVQAAQRILDIGAGTGLLALMLAQKSKAKIDGVEINRAAYEQASENVLASPWKDQILMHHQSIQNFYPSQRPRGYDLIISNPPFFDKHPKSQKADLNIAMHTDLLPLEDLWKAVQYLLKDSGKFVVMLPPYQMQLFIAQMRQRNWVEQKRLWIYNRIGQEKAFRVISTFQTEPLVEKEEEVLYIRDEQNAYSPAFRELLKAYYLIF